MTLATQSLFQAARRLRFAALLFLSAVAGGIVWNLPLPPTWEYTSPSEGTISVLGITKEGRVVTLDFPSDDELPPQLRVRDVESGGVIVDVPTPGTNYRSGVISGDGQSVILDWKFGGEVQVVSLKDGKPRYPALYARDINACSADGRFAVMKENDNRIVNLTTGEFKWQCDDETLFSPDSHQYLTVRQEGDNYFLSIRSLADNHEVLSDLIPGVSGGKYNWLQKWTGDRLYVSYCFKVAGSNFTDRRCWSYDTSGYRLSDPQLDPDSYSRLVNPRTYSHRYSRDDWAGEQQLHFPPPEGSLLYRIQDTLYDWNLPFGLIDIEYSWQAYSLQTKRPMGERIRGLHHDMQRSSDGRWLADGGDQLRVWRLPAKRDWSRWIQVILAATLPWGISLITWGRPSSARSPHWRRNFL